MIKLFYTERRTMFLSNKRKPAHLYKRNVKGFCLHIVAFIKLIFPLMNMVKTDSLPSHQARDRNT